MSPIEPASPQRRGIGRALVAHAMAGSPGSTIEDDNEPARRLYAALGFVDAVADTSTLRRPTPSDR